MAAQTDDRPELLIVTRPPLRADAIRLVNLIALLAVPLAMIFPQQLPLFLNVLSPEAALNIGKNPFFWVVVAAQLVHSRFMWESWKGDTDIESFRMGLKELMGYFALSIWVGLKEEFVVRWGTFFAISFLLGYIPITLVSNYVITLIATSFLFGYLHFNLSDYLRVRGALVGFMFGMIMITQGTILAAVLAHVAADALGSVMGWVLMKLKYRELTAGIR